MLADYCAAPGRPLTGQSNLRLADARHLVTALQTGDDPELGGHHKLQSAEDLPSLSRLVRLALDASVVRRKQGKLVAVARFAGLDEVMAYEKVVRAAVTAGLSGPPGVYFPRDGTRAGRRGRVRDRVARRPARRRFRASRPGCSSTRWRSTSTRTSSSCPTSSPA
jgi:hypothetical protein